MTGTKPFDRTTLEQALRELGRRTHAAGRVVEIAIYGGCAVMLTLNYRVATRDVDAVFEKDKDFVRKNRGGNGARIRLGQGLAQ